jgi:hypothetical protein
MLQRHGADVDQPRQTSGVPPLDDLGWAVGRFLSFVWAVLTEIHQCHACSCQEIPGIWARCARPSTPKLWGRLLDVGLGSIVRVSPHTEWLGLTSAAAAAPPHAQPPGGGGSSRSAPQRQDTRLSRLSRLRADAARATVGFVHMVSQNVYLLSRCGPVYRRMSAVLTPTATR